MGIGRLEFLRLSGLALTGAMVNPLHAVITGNQVYVNRKFGIMYTIPDTWGFIHVRDFGRLKEEQILGNGWNDFKDEIFEDFGQPICIATKYFQDTPENKGVFSPTITLNVTPKSELDEIGLTDFESVIEASGVGVAEMLRDFKIIKRYHPYMISGCKFYEFDATYLF